MALVKFGGGVASMSGKIGGTVFSRNRYGNYARNLTTPVNPKTERQEAVRNVLAYLSTAWLAINTEETQGESWYLYALNTPMLNRLGDTVYHTAINHFIRTNYVRLQGGLAVLPTMSDIFGLPETDSTASISAEEGTDEVSVAFDNAKEWANETGGYLLVYASRPMNSSINFFNGPFQYVSKVAGNTATPPTSPAAIPLNDVIAEGQKIVCQFRILRADGRLSEPFRRECVVGPTV
jgi:hypothetical protein